MVKYSFQSLCVCYAWEDCLAFRLKQLPGLDLHTCICINTCAHEPEEMERRLMIQFAWKLKQSAECEPCSKLSRKVCVVCHRWRVTSPHSSSSYWLNTLSMIPEKWLRWCHAISFGGKAILGNWLSLHSKPCSPWWWQRLGLTGNDWRHTLESLVCPHWSAWCDVCLDL